MEIAILMAAGMGTRMRPVTEKIPKPLVPVNGVPMIETVIEALQQRQVQKIYIVVGYLGDQFACLTEKYSNIEIIENKEYRDANNISSLYAAGDVLGSADCFICEADLVISDAGILRAHHETSCYYGRMVQGYSDDWAFDLDGTWISRVGKGGIDAYNMVGISYFKRKDAVFLRNVIRQAYEVEGRRGLFWDEVVNEHLDKLRLIVYPVSQDQIVEIDTVEELGRMDPRYQCHKEESK